MKHCWTLLLVILVAQCLALETLVSADSDNFANDDKPNTTKPAGNRTPRPNIAKSTKVKSVVLALFVLAVIAYALLTCPTRDIEDSSARANASPTQQNDSNQDNSMPMAIDNQLPQAPGVSGNPIDISAA